MQLNLISINQDTLNIFANANRIILALESLPKLPSIVSFPELSISGYGCEDGFYYKSLANESIEATRKIAAKFPNKIITIGLPVWQENNLYNCQAVLYGGKIIGIVPKQNLAKTGVYYEPRWFTAWEPGKVSTVDNIPFGDLVFDVNNIRFGFEICEDAWVKNRPAFSFLKRGVNLIINPSASHFAFGKNEIRKKLIQEGSTIVKGYYAFINLLGNDAGRLIFDGDRYLAKDNKLVYESTRFEIKDFSVLETEVNISNKNKIIDKDCITINLPGLKNKLNIKPVKITKPKSLTKSEEFLKATALGLYDYLRRTHQHGFALSLSGGADSVCTALLVRNMFDTAVKFKGDAAFNWINSGKKIKFKELLTTLYQETANNSNLTKKSAELVASKIGSKHQDVNIDPIINEYSKIILNTNYQNITNDIAKQNIQARVRSPSIWLIANLESKLLLTTSNRSEASVGYCTMDGDTSGGLSLLGDIDKSFIKQFLKQLEKETIGEFGPIQELKIVNSLKPSAELQSLDKKQEDEKDLMPYDVLQLIEETFLLDRKVGMELINNIQLKASARFKSKYNKIQINDWCKKFEKLWKISQWKRERFAVSFHLDSYSVDPKGWCRWPVI